MRLLVNEAVDIKCDVEWMTEIPTLQKSLTKAVTLAIFEYLSRLEKKP